MKEYSNTYIFPKILEDIQNEDDPSILKNIEIFFIFYFYFTCDVFVTLWSAYKKDGVQKSGKRKKGEKREREE